MKNYHLCLLVLLLSSCMPEDSEYHGYVEGEYIYITPTTSGVLASLYVERGRIVEKGSPLYSLDMTSLNTDNLSALADVEKAKANLEQAKNEYARTSKLSVTGAVSKSENDAQKATLQSATATLKAAEQKRIKIERQIKEAQPLSPATGRIENTFFREGEFVATGTPVISLLPPENVKVRFFVPQSELPSFQFGTALSIDCDGGKKAVPARVSFVSSKTEYTPPVIYSVGSRDKLVFMVEAKPEAFDSCLRPGLPVDINVVRQ